MKKLATALFATAALTAASQGATTITGTIGSQFKDSAGTNIAAGSLVLLIADTGTTGFLTTSAQGGILNGSTTALSGKTIAPADAGLTVGALFGGDTVMATSVAGASGSISGFAGFTATTSKNFAIVWFSTATPASGSFFGMMSLADWLMPADADGKSYSLSTSDAGGTGGFFSTSVSTTTAQLGSTGFITGTGSSDTTVSKNATFQIVPEPSAALLGAIGALGLLRRRRN